MSKIKENKPTLKSKYKQGYYKLNNTEKYIGDPTKIIYRSSWEHRFCCYCDLSPDIICWSSEPIGIPYRTPFDKPEHKGHLYYVDFFVRVKKSDDVTVDYMVEVKPESILTKPNLTGQKPSIQQIAAHNDQLKKWIINKSKFDAAKEYARKMGYVFIVVTEKFLYQKGV